MSYYYLEIGDGIKIGEATNLLRILTGNLADEIEEYGIDSDEVNSTMKAIRKIGWIITDNRDAIVYIDSNTRDYIIHELVFKKEEE